MKKRLMKIAVLATAILFSGYAMAQCGSSGKSKDVVDIAVGSKDHTTLVAAVKAADLVSTLKSDGPFTIFAPTNNAFAKLPNGTVESLLKKENKSQLVGVLTYHVVSGKLMAKDVIAAIKASNGTATVKTISGGTLKAMIVNGKVTLKDENGNTSTVSTTDLEGSNGVIHVIDSVVLPKG